MASHAQIKANRRNASFSTGPTTEPGKAVVAKNAVTHGFYCRHLLLHGESDEDLLALRKSIYDSLRPTDALETIYVERFVVAAWKLHRIVAAEPHHARSRDNLNRGSYAGPAPHTHAYDYAYNVLDKSANALKLAAALERSMDKTVAELMKLRKNRIDTTDAETIEPTATAVAPAVAPADAPSSAIVENKPNSPQDAVKTDPETPERAAAMKIDIVTPTPISKIAETNPIQVPTAPLQTEIAETNPIEPPGMPVQTEFAETNPNSTLSENARIEETEETNPIAPSMESSTP